MKSSSQDMTFLKKNNTKKKKKKQIKKKKKRKGKNCEECQEQGSIWHSESTTVL